MGSLEILFIIIIIIIIRLSVSLSLSLSVSVCLYLPVSVSVCLSVCLSLSLCLCLSVCLSVCLSLSSVQVHHYGNTRSGSAATNVTGSLTHVLHMCLWRSVKACWKRLHMLPSHTTLANKEQQQKQHMLMYLWRRMYPWWSSCIALITVMADWA